ncbi:MAG: response regulator [Desulfobaccales bacterium]
MPKEPIRILLMEDYPADAELFRKKMERTGLVVDHAPDGVQGLAMYQSGNYDLLVLDHAMPGYDGLEVVRRLASQGPLPPIVMVTGCRNDRVAVEALKLGALDYVVKDVEGIYLDLLPLVIERALHQHYLEAQMSLAAKVFANAREGILVTDRQGKIITVNQALTNISGYAPEEIIGQTLELLQAEPQGAGSHQKIWTSIRKSGEWQGEISNRRKNGEAFPAWLTLRAVDDRQGGIANYMGMLTDITKRKQNEAAISAYQEKLRSLASQLTLVEERERRRLAEQLHENIGQILAFARIKLGTLYAEAATPDLAADLSEILDQIDHSIQLTRSLTFDLSPTILYELGFGDAVQWLASRFQKSCGAEIEVQQEPLPPLTDDGRILLFLAVRELLMNVAKHAKASHAKVVITNAEDRLQIQVEDDGVGFNVPTSLAVGFGLFSIRERLEPIGGHLKVKSKPGHGAQVTLTIPPMPKDQMAEAQ